jgi:formylglycine-generating enzyme required for sulfatase activity
MATFARLTAAVTLCGPGSCDVRRAVVRSTDNASVLRIAAVLILAIVGASVFPGPWSATAAAARHRTFRDCSDCALMVSLPAARFLMGSPPSEPGRRDDEGPQRRVDIRHPFALAVYDVTRAEYARFVDATGYAPANPRCDWRHPTARGAPLNQQADEPVVCVSWTDANAYVRWLSARASHPYRLPTEAEWEYAARAGSASAHPWGPDADSTRANTAMVEGERPSKAKARWPYTSPVGSYPPNRFGLFDMLGNVWQWTADCGQTCDRHVLRGGAWFQSPTLARSAARVEDETEFRVTDIGFRVARSL